MGEFIERLHAPERPVLVFARWPRHSCKQIGSQRALMFAAACPWKVATKIWFSPPDAVHGRCIGQFSGGRFVM